MDECLNFEDPANSPIREMHQECTIIQRVGSEEVEFPNCKNVYIFRSGAVVVSGTARDVILSSSAGPIKITRTGNDPASIDDFDETEHL